MVADQTDKVGCRGQPWWCQLVGFHISAAVMVLSCATAQTSLLQ